MAKSPQTTSPMSNLGNKSDLQVFHPPTYLKPHVPPMTAGNNMNKTQDNFLLLGIHHHLPGQIGMPFRFRARLLWRS